MSAASELRCGALPHPTISSTPLRLLLLFLLEHAIESLIRRIAASLRRLRRLESLIRSALGAGSRLLRLGSCALRRVRRVLRSFRCGANHVELFWFHACTAHDRKAADERRCPQSSLDFCGH
jgi:hypothetical protein